MYHDKTKHKIVIKRANTDKAIHVHEGLYVTLCYKKHCRLLAYLDELRQQARWDAKHEQQAKAQD